MNFLTRESPWTRIKAKDYEQLMSHPAVDQLRSLKEIFREQYLDALPETLAYLGVCTGNGLEHVDPSVTKVIYGLDINPQFLEICRDRFRDRFGKLVLVQRDLNQDPPLVEPVDLVIANLVLEFVDADRFFIQLRTFCHKTTVISLVFQIKNKNPVVSNSGVEAMKVLGGFNQEVTHSMVDCFLEKYRFKKLKESSETLADGKVLVRVDFHPVQEV